MLSKKICCGVVPALLMSLSVGQIYAFTLFSTDIANWIETSQQAVQFAFSLGIFFLGMGAAFFGKIVENRIKLAACIGSALFIGGLIVAYQGISYTSLLALYLGYGLLLGLGTGTIYITPVKTLMMWFPRNKAVAAALPIIGFGLGSSLCTVLYNWLLPYYRPESMFGPLALIYLGPLLIGCTLLRKPDVDETQQLNRDILQVATQSQPIPYKALLKDKYFWRSWIFMFLNISAGLCLIPLAKQFMTGSNYNTELISWILIGMGLMNGAGRFAFALWSDFLKKRINILLLIAIISIGLMASGFIPVCIGIPLLLIPACYGAGFSCIPAIVHDHYGMRNVSTIHGAVLSAWGVAGLVGNQLALVAQNLAGMYGVIGLVLAMHVINLINIRAMKRL